jgi:hypothetical protein
MPSGSVKMPSTLIDRAKHAPGKTHAMNQGHRRPPDSPSMSGRLLRPPFETAMVDR